MSIASIAFAQGDVDIRFSTEREVLTVGDPLHLTLSITHAPGDIVIIPRLPQTWGDFEVHAQSQTETIVNDDGSVTTQQIIEATLFAPGTFETPPLIITIRDAAGQVAGMPAPPLTLNVTSVLREGDEQLRDLKPQVDLNVPPLWPWIAGGVLIAAIVFWLVYRWRRRRRRHALALAAQIDPRTPLQIALDELARIEGLNLPGQGRFKEHYTLVSDCLRRYLEEQHRVQALDRTTDELRLTLRRSRIDTTLARGVIDVLRDSDLVKFAKFIPEPSEAREIIARCSEIIKALEPRPVEIPPPPVESIAEPERVA